MNNATHSTITTHANDQIIRVDRPDGLADREWSIVKQAITAELDRIVAGLGEVPWWRGTDNPACPGWCATTHEPDEFSREGQISHVQFSITGDVADDQPINVHLDRMQVVSGVSAEAGTVVVTYDEVEVRLEGMRLGGDDCPPLREVLPVAKAILALEQKVRP